MCGENEKPIKVFKVSRPSCGNQHWISRDWDTIRDAEFDGMEIGDKIIIEVTSMTETQIENLPEFEGW